MFQWSVVNVKFKVSIFPNVKSDYNLDMYINKQMSIRPAMKSIRRMARFATVSLAMPPYTFFVLVQ